MTNWGYENAKEVLAPFFGRAKPIGKVLFSNDEVRFEREIGSTFRFLPAPGSVDWTGLNPSGVGSSVTATVRVDVERIVLICVSVATAEEIVTIVPVYWVAVNVSYTC